MKQNFFWNSLAFSMIQWMLAIWSLVPLPFLNPTCTSRSSQLMYCWSLAWRKLNINLLACEMNAIVLQNVLTKCGPLEKGMTNLFSILAWEPQEQYEKAKNIELEEELSQVGWCLVFYWGKVEKKKNGSRKNEKAEPRQKRPPLVDVSGGESKVLCCTEQYCIGPC